MNKILLLVAAIVFSTSAFSQIQLPAKLTKGIDVQKDDFGGGIKYTSNKTGLTILSKQNECIFTWELTCVDLAPISFNKVQILALGNVCNVSFAETEYKEYTETVRVPRNTFSGTKMSTTYVNEDRYIAKITTDASKHLQLLEDIVLDTQDTKIRFSGSKDVDGSFDKKEKSEIKTMLLIYKTLIE